ncbi:winged helix-turn-helix domain-containing protein [Belnapia sp. T18]|uniref:Winged helix-turn-helix domain-containing protein n=1 Tax=Belnapia arida TaxID=2804533 RepID=A0ABS1TYK8_9PROT|nr:winged helix-turn-helix domain-containing protein [Belnapia arida]MBL6076960.1 winged helix-turn-helix domain-containing protein [Belnapia arida]
MRIEDVSEKPVVLACGRVEADLGRRELRVLGAPVALGDRAFAILAALLDAPGALATKDELMRRIWPGAVVEENTLEVHVSALRRALGPDRALLKTAYGRGYRLLGTWTMRGPGLRHDAAPAPAAAGSLPLPLCGMIGRDIAIAQVGGMLREHRLVTLAGLGGIGKTRLAVEVARRMQSESQDEVRLAELAPLSDPGLVPSAVATAAGLRLGAAAPVAATIARAIGDRRLLLVLDNCEHVIHAAAEMVEAILRICPNLRVLATSREALRLGGERVYRVPPLDVPPPGLQEPGRIAGHGAVGLFVERMRSSGASFLPQDGDLPAVAAICRRLDGVPLAIEFAAARAGTLGLEQVLLGLDNRFELLTGGLRTALPRQQTLRATLDWSYRLLPEAERQLLRRLGVMAGGFGLAAARAVAGEREGDPDAAAVLGDLGNLVGKALVVLEEAGPATRWRLLETVRAYALERLAESGEEAAAARRHAEFLRDLFVPGDAARQLPSTVESAATYGRELDNVRAALDWAFSGTGDAAMGVALSAAYMPYLFRASSMAECRDRAERALAHLAGAGLDARLEAQLRITLGLALVYTTDQVKRTGAILARAVELASGLATGDGGADTLLQALWATFIYKFNNSEHRDAQAFAERFAELAQRKGDPADVLMADRMMGTTLHYAGGQPEARRRYHRYLRHYAGPCGQRHLTWLHYDGPVLVKARLARVLWLQGHLDRSRTLAERNICEARAQDHPMSECLAIGEAACPIAMMVGDFDAAQRYLAMLAEIAGRHSFSFWLGMARCLEAKLLIRRGEAARGTALLSAAIGSFGAAQQSLHYSGFVPDLAEGLAATGDAAGAAAIIEEALKRAERSGVRWHIPELLRLKGELLLRSPDNPTVPGEACFEAAMTLAAQQGAPFWRLRAALSLARLRLRQGRPREARLLLTPVHAGFTEGLGTADVQAARTLLERCPAQGDDGKLDGLGGPLARAM